MDKDRLEVLLFNAIDMLLASYDRQDILDETGMTLGEYEELWGDDDE